MKVVYITPTYFSSESILGGAERFAMELAKAMSRYVSTEIISFGQSNKIIHLSDNLRLYILKKWNKDILNPFNPFFLRRLKGADIIHCLQYMIYPTKLAIIFAKVFKKKIFVTDTGLASPHPTWYFDWSRWIDRFLVISKFSATFLNRHYASKEVIYPGVDGERYRPAAQKEKRVLFVGRLLPHKGIHHLIEAMPGDVELDIVGQVYDEKYYRLLKELAVGKKINFFHNLTDEEIVNKFSIASIFVSPVVYKHELFNLVFLEAMASGCATIGTNVGGIPEIIIDGKTGFIVPAGDSNALRERIEYLIGNPDMAMQMGKIGGRLAEEKFNWDLAAKKCLMAYGFNL